MPNTKQISLARTLISNTGNTDRKEAIISGFTGERTTSISQMTDGEFKALIAHLKGLNPADKIAEKKRRKIISMAHEMGWRKVDGNGRLVFKNGKPVADMKRIDAWCLQQFGKKRLDAYTDAELSKLIYAFEQVYLHYFSKK